MSKLTDKIEALLATRERQDTTWDALRDILADVRELERRVNAHKFGTAYRQGVKAGVVSGAKQLTAEYVRVIRAAKCEAYEHARQICIKHAPAGMSAHKPLLAAYDAIADAIDALDTEGNSDE